MNPKLNSGALIFMWALTALMAGAITLGATHIYVVAGLITVYAFYAVN